MTADILGAHRALAERLLAARSAGGHWVGELSSSALSTATAVTALSLARQSAGDRELADRGLAWLVRHQNADGGWGDTTRSASNLSTTAVCWAALTFAPPTLNGAAAAVTQCESWLERAAGGLQPGQLQSALANRYGKDRTFSAPILTMLALCDRLGPDGWRSVPQLPFELAACPPRWFQWLQLPVVSYALPALIAIGEVRHHHRPSPNPAWRALRRGVAGRARAVLRRIQPATGGYLEATPLTSFVVMSLAGMNQGGSEVAVEGLRFLRASMREDGSWPIDTHLATWVTTLSINALAHSGGIDLLTPDERRGLAEWLLAQQHLEEHPYTAAAPGGWAWTPLAGGVPDADDTAGALLALRQLRIDTERTREAAAAGVRWLLNLQNRDGGIPTFCRGWGALPFDRSAPDLTAHALRAWRAWRAGMTPAIARRIDTATSHALHYLANGQRADGTWLPLWFGNEQSRDDGNPTYGTTRVLLALADLEGASAGPMRDRATAWLLRAQNDDGGWGGDIGTASSIEETAVTIEALAAVEESASNAAVAAAVTRGVNWLVPAAATGMAAAPIGLYFAKLWYFETLYPLIFACAALSRACGLGRPAPQHPGDGRSEPETIRSADGGTWEK